MKFLPGDANKGQFCIKQASWKNRHIIAYASGNNLIIYLASKLIDGKCDQHVQTIYLHDDIETVELDSRNGFIFISIGNQIIVFKPLNDFAAQVQWSEACKVDVPQVSRIKSMSWASCESELVVGSSNGLSLYFIYEEYGEIHLRLRWSVTQPTEVSCVKIADDGSKVLSIGEPFDRLVKLWNRVNYDDSNSFFELSYLPHPLGVFVLDIFIRRQENIESNIPLNKMTRMRNMRGFLTEDNYNINNDVIYTYSSDKIFRAWVSQESTGHVHFKLWESINLNNIFDNKEVISVSLIEHRHLKNTLLRFLSTTGKENKVYSFFKFIQDHTFDLLLIVDQAGNFIFYALVYDFSDSTNIINIKKLPMEPRSLGSFSSPHIHFENIIDVNSPVTLSTALSKSFQLFVKPIVIPQIINISVHESEDLSLIIHDRCKDNIRFSRFNFLRFIQSDGELLDARLYQKFQGQQKSIRKLFKSKYSKKSNVLLSTSNFPEFNYIWEPIHVGKNNQEVTITKRFQIDTGPDSLGIWDAVVIADIFNKKSVGRNHIAILMERNGTLSVWNCNQTELDNHRSSLVRRIEILEDNLKTKRLTRAFFSVEVPTNIIYEKCYLIIAVFDYDFVRSWKLEILSEQDVQITLTEFPISSVPVGLDVSQIAPIDSQQDPGVSVLSTITTNGHFKSFSLEITETLINWKQEVDFFTNVYNPRKMQESLIISRLAIIDSSGTKLSIWDTRSGILEYEEDFKTTYGKVVDLDWTFITSDDDSSSLNAVLSVGFERTVLLYTQLRYDYTNDVPTFGVLKKIDISDFTLHDIGDSIWLNDGYLVIGTGNQFFINDKGINIDEFRGNFLDSTIRQLLKGFSDDKDEKIERKNPFSSLRRVKPENIWDIEPLVRILNGPLPLYHPQFLIQCLYMNQYELVKAILLRLLKVLRTGAEINWDLDLDMSAEILGLGIRAKSSVHSSRESISSSIMEQVNLDQNSISIYDEFNKHAATLLIQELTKVSLPLLTRHQQITLTFVISILGDLELNATSLDSSGSRFLIGFKLFEKSHKQVKLTMRDISWALHTENKEFILSLIEQHFKFRYRWENLMQTGLVYWVKQDRFRSIVESCARNEFAETRDPSGIVSLLYIALRKKQILIGLWRTVSHPEKTKLLAFLTHNFSEARWKSAANKNAFVLLGKHRYIDAAYFFLLGGLIKDCCTVLADKLGNHQLALTIAKIYTYDDPSERDVVYKALMENYILPKAITQGDRWMTSWIFWELNMPEISVQALVKAPIDVVLMVRDIFSSFFRKNYLDTVKVDDTSRSFIKDDPALILLFSILRTRSVNYLKGSLEVTPQEEFDYIIKMCSIYSRMGCDYLSILLISNWSFINLDSSQNQLQWDFGKATGFTSKMDIDIGETSQKQKHNINGNGNTIVSKLPPASAFEEPDMSSFDFGF